MTEILPNGANSLTRRLTAPAAALRDLPEILRLDIQRGTPFDPDSVFLAPIKVSRQGAAAIIDYAVIKRAPVEVEIARRKAQGVETERLLLEPENPDDPPILIAEFDTPRRRRARRRARLALGLAVAALLLGLGHLLAPQLQQQRQLDGLTAELAALEAEAVARRQELEARRAAGAADRDLLIARQSAAIDIWATLTERLGDETWLTAFAIDANRHPSKLSLSGFTRGDVAEIITSLEAAESFENARLAAPTALDKTENAMRFDLAIDLTPEAPEK